MWLQGADAGMSCTRQSKIAGSEVRGGWLTRHSSWDRGSQLARSGAGPRDATAWCSSPSRPHGSEGVPGAGRHSPAVMVPSCLQKGQQQQQALHLLRVMQRHAIVSNVITESTAISARGEGPVAPAGLASLTSGAAPCHRAGCDHLQCSHLCVRKGPAAPAGLTPFGAMQCYAIVPDVIRDETLVVLLQCGSATVVFACLQLLLVSGQCL